MTSIAEQDRQITEAMAEESSRLRNFIRRRVPAGVDVEDLLQETFYELIKAHRLLMPIDTVSAWLFRVARNRITDLFRKKTPETFSDLEIDSEDGEAMAFEDLLPSPEDGPEAVVQRRELMEALQAAIAGLPEEQREVFIAHELEGRSFNELAAETGININTLLARKRYAVLALRKRLKSVHDEVARK